jgi:hypothetical protein
MKRIKAIWTSILIIAVGAGCEPQPDDIKLLDEFVVSTNFDPDADFNSYQTYYIPQDTIGLVSNLASDDTIIVGNNYARPVVIQVQSNMSARGYQSVDLTDDPDLAINAYVLKNLNIFQDVNYYPGAYGYPGYYYPGYYGYYGYNYYPYVTTYAYNTGVLVIEIVDLKNVTPQNEVTVIWDAYLGDVFSSVDLSQQTLDGIDQAFFQSTYLTKQ